jgi:signal transduction histidine kinase
MKKKTFLFLLVCISFIGLDAKNNLSELQYFTDSTFTQPITVDMDQSYVAEVWLKVEIEINENDFPKYLEIGSWDKVLIYSDNILVGQTGKMVPIPQRIYASHRNLVPIHKTGIYHIKVSGSPTKPSSNKNQKLLIHGHKDLMQAQSNRLIGQSIFFGLILVMSLYNLMIYFSVRDRSYLYYVLSIVGIGLYLFFVYGFSIEYFWPNSPRWDAHFFALIIPLTNIARIYFTKSYLHTSKKLVTWNRFLDFLTLCYSIPLILWFVGYWFEADTLDYANNAIGILGTTVLTTITIVSVLVYRQGYRPALWFLTAYVLFNIGGILFIFRELGYIGDNFFTRYLIQYGVGAQVILFSLGLASRLNETRNQLTQEVIQKEKLKRQQEVEKKRIIEQQNLKLETKVQERTAELESLVEQMTQSEQELKDLNSLKDKLFAIISHDLKSPLTTFDSFLNLMIHHHQQLSQEEMTRLSSKTKTALHNLTLLLDNLLQWSRVQQNYVGFHPTSVDLLSLVEKNKKLFKLQLEEKEIQLKYSFSEWQQKVWVDKDMIDFVIRNILHNAIKFSTRGGQIVLSLYEDQDQAVISIRDYGRGMTQREIDQITIYGERFSKVGTEKEKGTGIGLMMCKDFIERSSGSFYLNKKAQGIEVSFTCPLPSEIMV